MNEQPTIPCEMQVGAAVFEKGCLVSVVQFAINILYKNVVRQGMLLHGMEEERYDRQAREAWNIDMGR